MNKSLTIDEPQFGDSQGFKGMIMKSTAKLLAATILAFGVTVTSANATTLIKDEYQDFESAELVPFVASDAGGAAREANAPGNGFVVQGFQGISQYDVATFARNFIPPDTMGAVGATQYTSFVNGGFAVFDKATGTQTKLTSDLAFWAAAGQTGANGDSRVLFDKAANRWVALSFGNSVSDIQIAVSNTADATGVWKSTKFTGFAGGTADYPTLAMDANAFYIGTNDFNAAGSFSGTTLNVIPLASVVNGAAPTTAGLKQFFTPYTGVGYPTDADRGFAIQGVNSDTATTTGHVIAASLFFDDVVRYNVNNAGTPGATETATQFVGVAEYDQNGPARQPNAVPDANPNATFTSNDRVIDTLDPRIGSSAYEVGGRIYSVYTVTPIGTDHTAVRYDVVDAATNKLLDEGMISDATHDYWEGSLAVNAFGQVVIAYNRSGSDPADGKVSFLARSYSTGADGKLTQRNAEALLKVSAVDDYHNGSVDGQVAAGRQRWGDYSSVTLDPNDPRSFWAIGEYAREYNDAAGGHPGGTGGSRWSTWITQLNVGTAVPEPASWAMMIAGFGLVGAAMRRRRGNFVVA